MIAGALAVMAAVPALAAQSPKTGHASAENPPGFPPDGFVDNPELKVGCGLRVLMVLDNSGSIATQANATLATQTAARDFVSALDGTGSPLAITKFSASVSAEGRGAQTGTSGFSPAVNSVLRATPIYRVVNDTTVGNFESFISDFQPSSTGSGATGTNNATNWEAALHSARLTPNEKPDLVLLITDGNPTARNLPPTAVTVGAGDNPDVWAQNLPAAIREAGLVKDQETRIFALGVGAAITGTNAEISAQNLRAISGKNRYPESPFYDLEHPEDSADYMIDPDFGTLAETLRTFVRSLCAPSVTITKMTEHVNGQTEPASGWQFTGDLATEPAGHRWVFPELSGSAVTGARAVATTDAFGIARFAWRLDDASATSTLSILREHNSDHPDTSFGEAQCTKVTPDGNVNLTPDPEVAIPKIELSPDDYATCDVLNLGPRGTIEIRKEIVPPEDDPGKFNLLLNSTVEEEDIGAPGGGTRPITVPVGGHEVSEKAAAGTDLAHYDTTVECVNAANNDAVVVAKHTVTGAEERSTPVDVANGAEIVCTFINTSNQDGEITVIKHLIPAGSGTFDLLAGGHTVAHGVGDGGHGSVRVPFGTHEVTEHPAGGTNLSHFQISTVCFADGVEVAHNNTGPTVSVPVTRHASDVECTITNHRPDVPVGHLEVIKHLVPDGSGLFDLSIGGTVLAHEVGNDGTTGPLEVELGTHEVTEHATPGSGTNLADFVISTTCVNTATGAVVAHNASGPSVSVDVASTTDNIVCTITNGLDRPPEGGGGGGHTPPPTPGVEAPQLSVVKTLPGQAPLGSIIPVTIRVTNHGRTAAHGVQVAETRPAGLQIVHVAGGTLLHTGTAVWFVGTLAPGHSRTVHATARVVAVGLHRDTAIATAGNADPALADAAVRAATHAPVPPVAPGVAPPPLVTG